MLGNLKTSIHSTSKRKRNDNEDNRVSSEIALHDPNNRQLFADLERLLMDSPESQLFSFSGNSSSIDLWDSIFRNPEADDGGHNSTDNGPSSFSTQNQTRDAKSTDAASDQRDKSSETGGNCVVPLESNEIEKSSKSPLCVNEKEDEVDYEQPAIGMVFSSEEAAYEFYNNYALQIGFKVRKGKVQRLSNGTIKKRYFYCSKQGFRSRTQNDKRTKYTRKETRTGCEAKIQLTVEKEESEKWKITRVILEHNHDDLKISSEMHSINEDILQAHLVHSINEDAGSVMSNCNYLQETKSNNIQPEDCQNLLNYFCHMQVKDPTFFYTVQVDSLNTIRNFFWTDDRSKMDYGFFGDVVIFDTTFRINKYDMICAPFLGLNHHQQFVLFGCAFLLDENADSFTWLFRSFMKAMDKCQPKTIFTDEGQAVADAISKVLSRTQHRLGAWYICQNAEKHVSEHYKQPGFISLFSKCLIDCQSREEFELMWDLLVKKYKLGDHNSWMETLRNKWSLIFAEKTFSAGIESVLDTQNTANFFQNMTSETMWLLMFFKQYEKSVEQRRREELSEDCRSNESVPMMFSSSQIEKQAAAVYTSRVFKIFQDELRRILSVAIEEQPRDGNISKFKLVEEGDKREYIAAFDASDSTITCSCGNFETVGILCVHALKVLNWQNIFCIPQQYILKRWRKDVKDKAVEEQDKEANGKDNRPLILQASELKSKALSLIDKSAASEESLKLVENYLENAAKGVEDLLQRDPVEVLRLQGIESSDAKIKKVLNPNVLSKKVSKCGTITETTMTLKGKVHREGDNQASHYPL